MIDQLPIVLSGPMLRRVDQNKAIIWIATRESFTIYSKMYTVNKIPHRNQYRYKKLNVATEQESICIGRYVYIHLLTVTPTEEQFPTNTLIGYNLFFQNKDAILDLHDVKLISNDKQTTITYGNLELPTFFIPNKNIDAPILYGSCRKVHGDGDDALVSGDLYVEQNHLLLSKRPQSLFLTGDQIYADDISDSLIPSLFWIGKLLFGPDHDEKLWEVDRELQNEPYKAALYRLQGRQPISDERCKFTSTSAGNHLFFFHEFVAMYLMNWSPKLWKTAEKHDYFIGKLHEDGCYFKGATATAEHNEHRTLNTDTMKSFQSKLSNIQRLMANTPTYMIFDDHDVTDDWNLSLKWKNNVYKAPLGRHVVSNALAAYWLFQGWGNNPDSFGETFKTTMNEYFKHFDVASNSYEEWSETLWNFADWHFVAPTKPESLFIDTRTARKYNLEKENGPRLLNDSAYSRLTNHIGLMKQNNRSNKPLLIISPAPVYGVQIIESFLKNYMYPLRSYGIPVHKMFDLETWAFNEKGFHEFISWIGKQRYSNCIILSGDAHHAFSSHASALYSNKKMNIYQFTSSPLKNESFPKLFQPIINAILTIEYNIKNMGSSGSSHNRQLSSSNKSYADIVRELKEGKNIPLDGKTMVETKNNLGLLWAIEKKASLLTYDHDTKRLTETTPQVLN